MITVKNFCLLGLFVLFVNADVYKFPWHVEHWLKPEPKVVDYCILEQNVQSNRVCEIDPTEEFQIVETLSHDFLPLLRTIVEINDFHPSKISSKTKQYLHRLYSSTQAEDLLSELLSFSFPSNTPCVLSWIHSRSHNYFHPHHNLSLIIPYLQKSCSFLSTLQSSLLTQRDIYYHNNSINVLVVGAGPAGLISAISAYSQGAVVQVHEKRNEYRRDTWFDLESKPWSTTRETLEKEWGIGYQELEHVVHDLPVITVRTQNLERFLSKVVTILNIPISYHSEFITFCNQSNQFYGIFYNTSYQGHPESPSDWCAVQTSEIYQKTPFDLIVGCDGFASRVRNASQIDFPVQTTFSAVRGHKINEKNLHQSSMIVNFNPLPSGECPHLKYDDSGYLLDPRYPSFSVNGVTSVWKRFYKNYCQFQILFTHEVGNKIVRKYEQLVPKKLAKDSFFWREKSPANAINDSAVYNWQSDAIPWQKLLSITNLLFVDQIPNIPALQNIIAKRRYDAHLFDIEVVNVVIHKANENTKILSSSSSSNSSKFAIASLSGDSSVTAHYRLGVGINNAFLALPEFAAMVRNLNSIEANSELVSRTVEEKNERADRRASRLVQFELSTMFYESFCDYSIYFDRSKENYWETQILFKKDKRTRQFEEMNDDEVIKHCTHLQGKINILS